MKRVRSHEDSRKDTLYGHLDDLEESLGEMHSSGDSIVRFGLSILGTHLLLITPNLLSITQDLPTRRQTISSPFAAE